CWLACFRPEDGIRAALVTGVQTSARPVSPRTVSAGSVAAAASRPAATVRGVLSRVQATRDRLAALAQGTAAAREAAQTAALGLGTVAAEAQANDVWSREIANMAGEMRTLVEEISARLSSVAQGTETLLASAEEIAASSEEQSASTQEIAASANQLADAA